MSRIYETKSMGKVPRNLNESGQIVHRSHSSTSAREVIMKERTEIDIATSELLSSRLVWVCMNPQVGGSFILCSSELDNERISDTF